MVEARRIKRAEVRKTIFGGSKKNGGGDEWQAARGQAGRGVNDESIMVGLSYIDNEGARRCTI